MREEIWTRSKPDAFNFHKMAPFISFSESVSRENILPCRGTTAQEPEIKIVILRSSFEAPVDSVTDVTTLACLYNHCVWHLRFQQIGGSHVAPTSKDAPRKRQRSNNTLNCVVPGSVSPSRYHQSGKDEARVFSARNYVVARPSN